MPELKNKKREEFCQLYAMHFNQTSAYFEAYRESCSDRLVANTNAARLMREDEIRDRIEELVATRKKNSETERERVINETKKLANASVQHLFNFKGNKLKVKDWSEVPEELLDCIESVKIDINNEDGEVLNIKFHSKTKAIDMLHKIYGNYQADDETKNINKLSETVEDFLRKTKEIENGKT